MSGLVLTPADVSALVEVLRPSLATVPARRALVELALGFGSRALDGIDWSGDAQAFTVHLIGVLAAYGDVAPGEPALVAVLEMLRGQVGVDRQAAIDGLVAQLRAAGGRDGASGGSPAGAGGGSRVGPAAGTGIAVGSGSTPGQRRRKADRLAELQAKYDTFGRRIAALDTDIGRETDSLRRQVLEERKAEVVAERDAVAAEMGGLEHELGAQG